MTVNRKKRPLPAGPVIRREAAMAYTGLSDSGFDEGVASGEFPAPFRSRSEGRICVWLKSEWDEWLRNRLAQRDAERAAKKTKVMA